MKATGTPILLAVLLVGCGYGATVEKRGITQQAEPLRILNRQIRIYDCAGVPPGSKSCQYMRFQVALDKPDPPQADGSKDQGNNQVTVRNQVTVTDKNQVTVTENQVTVTENQVTVENQGAVEDHVTVRGQKQDGAGKKLEEQKDQASDGAPISAAKDDICPDDKPGTLALRYEVRKYPSSEVTKHAHDMTSAQHLPVKAQLQQRAFLSNVGFKPRWSVDPDRVEAGTVRTQKPGDEGAPLKLEICEKKQVANLDLVLLDEHINKGATGDVYRLEVWRESDKAKSNISVESLNTVAQYGLGSAITGVLLIGAYIFFGATR